MTFRNNRTASKSTIDEHVQYRLCPPFHLLLTPCNHKCSERVGIYPGTRIYTRYPGIAYCWIPGYTSKYPKDNKFECIFRRRIQLQILIAYVIIDSSGVKNLIICTYSISHICNYLIIASCNDSNKVVTTLFK